MTVGNLVSGHEQVEEQAPPPAQAWTRFALVLAVLAVVAWWQWSVALFILILLVSITLHELGHYLGARWGGMKPTEFFIGFGPRIFSWRRGETEYGLKPILAGAYVKVPGMTNLEEVDPADEPRTYRAQSFGRRFRMVFAGPAMNLLIALVGFIGFFTLYDEQQVHDTGTPTVYVADRGPAVVAGLRDGDRVLAVDGRSFGSIEDIVDYVRARPGATVDLEIDRSGTQLDVPVALAAANPSTGEAVGYLGVAFEGDVTTVDRNLPEGVQAGFTEFGRQIGATVTAIGRIFSPSGLADLGNTVLGRQADNPAERPTSIVGITEIGSDLVRSGVRDALAITASLNLALGMFNLLPVLPFDGGHLVIAVYERIRSRRGRRYHVDFSKAIQLFAPIIAVVLFVVISAVLLDIGVSLG